MASAGNPSPDSKRTERGLRHRLSRVSLTHGAKGSNDANSSRGDLPSRRPKLRIQPISPSDHAPSSHTTPSPTADKPDDEFLERAKVFIDELYQPYKFAMSKYFYFDSHRGKVVLYLAARQKREYVSRHKKEKAEIKRVDLEVNQAIEDLQRAHRELVKQKEKGFDADGHSNDKPNADTEAFSENILKVLPICTIDKTVDVLSYLNKAVEALRNLFVTYNRTEILELRGEYEKLDSKRLERRQQSASEQVSTATTKSTADPYHSNVVKLHQKAENMRRRENEKDKLRIHRYNLTAKLDRQMEKTDRLRRKLEASRNATMVEYISAPPIIP
ncbi:hypothetical protein ACEPAI_10085 [Sanghuangporus weigelae]